MIETYEKFKILDVDGRPAAIVEVNWNTEDKKTNQCKILRFTYPDKTVSYVKRELLNELLFAIGKSSDQMKMVPQKHTRVRWYETVIGVRAKKDIRKNEMINFPLKISLPTVEEEVITEVSKRLKIPKFFIEKK